MAYPESPQFYKTGNPYGNPTTPLTFENGRSFPASHLYRPNQKRKEDGAGNVSTVSHGVTTQLMQAKFSHISQDQVTQLINFFLDPTVDWSANSFYFKDEYGVVHEVHYWDDDTSKSFERDMSQTITVILKKVG